MTVINICIIEFSRDCICVYYVIVDLFQFYDHFITVSFIKFSCAFIRNFMDLLQYSSVFMTDGYVKQFIRMILNGSEPFHFSYLLYILLYTCPLRFAGLR